MNENHNYNPDPSDFNRFNENIHKFPPEELLKYRGQHVAWSLDGTRILASAGTEEELEQRLRAAGIDPRLVVPEFFSTADSVLL